MTDPTLYEWRDISEAPRSGVDVIVRTQNGAVFSAFWRPCTGWSEGDIGDWKAAHDDVHPTSWEGGQRWLGTGGEAISEPPTHYLAPVSVSEIRAQARAEALREAATAIAQRSMNLREDADAAGRGGDLSGAALLSGRAAEADRAIRLLLDMAEGKE